MSGSSLAPWARYALALVALVIAVGVRIVFHPWLGDRFPFLTLLAAILISARYCGNGPTLLSLFLGSFAAALVLLPGGRTLTFATADYAIGLGFFFLVGLGSLYLFQSLHEARVAERLQRERLQTTLNSMSEGMIALDAEGRVRTMNPAAESLTGWHQAESLGKPVEGVFKIVNENTRQPVENPALLALRDGVAVDLADGTILISRDGKDVPIDDSAGPIRDAERHVSGSVLVFREVANRRMAEQQLRASERQFRKLAESIPQLAWMTRPDGYIEWYNRRWYEYTGTTPEQMEGWGWQSVHDPQELPRVLKHWKEALETGTPWEDTFPLRRADGQMRWHLSRAAPVRDDEGRIIRWFGTNTDITERMQFEQELKKAARRKDEFMATLAHELRNPLAALQNGLELQRLLGGENSELEESRVMMVRQVQQMIRLVDDLLDLSRLRRYKLRLKPVPLDVRDVVSAAVAACRSIIDAAGHQLNLSLPSNPLTVNADADRLCQVFTNLLNNAAKYTERGGKIDVELTRQGSDCLVSVRDNGMGIPADQLPGIFELFTQVDKSVEQSRGGLGIGLALVRSIVELHGGSVEAHSEGAGMGSEFVVRLPLMISPAVVSNAPRQVEADWESSGRGRVLLVDDNPDATASMRLLLETKGYQVRTAADGVEALEVAQSFRPDVALLDIGLPRLNGYALARKLREFPWGKGMLLIATTGWGQDDDRARSREAGFDHHLVKPVDLSMLLKLLAGLQPRHIA